MYEPLLPQPVEKVLFLRVGALGHYALEIIHKRHEHFAVDGRQLQALAPIVQRSLLGLQLLQVRC